MLMILFSLIQLILPLIFLFRLTLTLFLPGFLLTHLLLILLKLNICSSPSSLHLSFPPFPHFTLTILHLNLSLLLNTWALFSPLTFLGPYIFTISVLSLGNQFAFFFVTSIVSLHLLFFLNSTLLLFGPTSSIAPLFGTLLLLFLFPPLKKSSTLPLNYAPKGGLPLTPLCSNFSNVLLLVFVVKIPSLSSSIKFFMVSASFRLVRFFFNLPLVCLFALTMLSIYSSPLLALLPSSIHSSLVPVVSGIFCLLLLKTVHLYLVLSLIYISQLAILISICNLIIVILVLFVLACAIENTFLLYKKRRKRKKFQL